MVTRGTVAVSTNIASGQIALLFSIVRYLWVAGEGGDIDQLDGPLRAEAAEILAGLGVPEHVAKRW